MAQWDANGKKIDAVRKKLEDDEKAAKEAGTTIDDTLPEYDIDPYDGYISLCGIALEKAILPHFTDEDGNPVKTLYNGKRQLTPEYRKFLEDALDQETIFRIIEICGGIKLNDENLVQMIQQAQEAEAVAAATANEE